MMTQLISHYDAIANNIINLKDEYYRSLITSDELESKLLDLMICLEDGVWYMVGFNTMKWYFYDSVKSQWVLLEEIKQ